MVDFLWLKKQCRRNTDRTNYHGTPLHRQDYAANGPALQSTVAPRFPPTSSTLPIRCFDWPKTDGTEDAAGQFSVYLSVLPNYAHRATQGQLLLPSDGVRVPSPTLRSRCRVCKQRRRALPVEGITQPKGKSYGNHIILDFSKARSMGCMDSNSQAPICSVSSFSRVGWAS